MTFVFFQSDRACARPRRSACSATRRSGRWDLLRWPLALLQQLGAATATSLIVAGLFVNHLFAKAGLFWLAGSVGGERLAGLVGPGATPASSLVFAILLAAIAGLPPFPGFWAKWHLVLNLAAGERYSGSRSCCSARCWKRPICSDGSGDVIHADGGPARASRGTRATRNLLPVCRCGAAPCRQRPGTSLPLPVCRRCLGVPAARRRARAYYLLDGLPGRVKALLVIAAHADRRIVGWSTI